MRCSCQVLSGASSEVMQGLVCARLVTMPLKRMVSVLCVVCILVFIMCLGHVFLSCPVFRWGD